MKQYQAYFHHKELGSSTGMYVSSPTSICYYTEADRITHYSIFMIYTVGNMIGSLFTGPICDKFGRRMGMITGSALILIGAAIQTAAQTDAYLIGGRFVLGFGVSIGTSSAPTYALELAPPQWRARIVGYYNTCECACLATCSTCWHTDF